MHLMAVNDVGPEEVRQKGYRERVDVLATQVVPRTGHGDVQRAASLPGAGAARKENSRVGVCWAIAVASSSG